MVPSRSLSRFRAELAETVKRVRETKRPVVVTQRGESSVAIVDVAEYQALLDQVELLDDVAAAERELDAGLGLDSSDARAEVKRALRG